MKIHGKSISLPKPEVIVIPRDGDDIVFIAKAIIDFSEFDTLCPSPIPPIITKRDGSKFPDAEDAKFLAKIEKQSQKRYAWLILKSLEDTEGLEWETVDMKNPDTWLNYEKELSNSGFNQREINKIIEGIMAANSLDDERFKQAKERFLRSQAEKET